MKNILKIGNYIIDTSKITYVSPIEFNSFSDVVEIIVDGQLRRIKDDRKVIAELKERILEELKLN